MSYDYFSIMHYGPKVFSKNGLKTIGELKDCRQLSFLLVNKISKPDLNMN